MDLFNTFLLGMMLGSIYGIIIWSATGLLGGLTMAWIVKLLLKSISARDFWVIVWGWFIGVVTGFILGNGTVFAIFLIAWAVNETHIEPNDLLVVATMIGGLIAGGIGSGIMYLVIDRELAS